ncbi:T3SS effector HopA1 family protein [Streptomyces vinaceus]|uniref:T3SS effector HopA1 family protein n=1 Tax=Streptomyces vinaceus TaxID=1960 RepID=UPI0035D795C8
MNDMSSHPPAAGFGASPDAAPLLSEKLEDALDGVHVHEDGLTASVNGRTVTGTSPLVLSGQLATALYQVIHVGKPARVEESREGDKDRGAAALDRDLEADLAGAVPHRYTRHRVPVLADAPSGPIVGLSGVRVRLEPHRLVEEGAGSPHEATVLVAAARPSLSPGFFLADGSTPLAEDDPVLRVYVHVRTPEAAVEAWSKALEYLEAQSVPYRAKASSSRGLLPRRDGVVVYMGSRHQAALPGLARAVTGTGGLGSDCSPFTRALAPGVAVAWEPDDDRPGMRNTSLGEHRSRAIASGLVRKAIRPDGRLRAAFVRDALLEAGIDPSDPSRNLSSPPLISLVGK